MLNALKQDKDILFYNVFGMIRVESGKITVSANAVRSGKMQRRTVTEEVNNPLRLFTIPFTVPFGAWLDGEDVHLAVSETEAQDHEVLNANRAAIEAAARRTTLLMKGMME